MSSYSSSWTVPAPVANIIPAAVYAAPTVGMKVQAQTPYSFKCRSGLTFTTYPVTLEINVSGVDGAATISMNAHNFGFGPLQTGACRDRVTKLFGAMSNILQAWAQQQAGPATAPQTGPTS